MKLLWNVSIHSTKVSYRIQSNIMEEAQVLQFSNRVSRIQGVPKQATLMAPPAKRMIGLLTKPNSVITEKPVQQISEVRTSVMKETNSIFDVCKQVKLSFQDRRQENDDLRLKIRRCKQAISGVSKQTNELSLEIGAMNSGMAFHQRRHELFSQDIAALEEQHHETENIASRLISVKTLADCSLNDLAESLEKLSPHIPILMQNLDVAKEVQNIIKNEINTAQAICDSKKHNRQTLLEMLCKLNIDIDQVTLSSNTALSCVEDKERVICSRRSELEDTTRRLELSKAGKQKRQKVVDAKIEDSTQKLQEIEQSKSFQIEKKRDLLENIDLTKLALARNLQSAEDEAEKQSFIESHCSKKLEDKGKSAISFQQEQSELETLQQELRDMKSTENLQRLKVDELTSKKSHMKTSFDALEMHAKSLLEKLRQNKEYLRTTKENFFIEEWNIKLATIEAKKSDADMLSALMDIDASTKALECDIEIEMKCDIDQESVRERISKRLLVIDDERMSNHIIEEQLKHDLTMQSQYLKSLTAINEEYSCQRQSLAIRIRENDEGETKLENLKKRLVALNEDLNRINDTISDKSSIYMSYKPSEEVVERGKSEVMKIKNLFQYEAEQNERHGIEIAKENILKIENYQFLQIEEARKKEIIQLEKSLQSKQDEFDGLEAPNVNDASEEAFILPRLQISKISDSDQSDILFGNSIMKKPKLAQIDLSRSTLPNQRSNSGKIEILSLEDKKVAAQMLKEKRKRLSKELLTSNIETPQRKSLVQAQNHDRKKGISDILKTSTPKSDWFFEDDKMFS